MTIRIDRLTIAEKPNLAKLIASHLPGTKTVKKGYIETSKGEVVTWCYGHMFKLAPVSYYLAGSRGFKMEELPVIPKNWQLIENEDQKEQIQIIGKLLKDSKEVLHAGDPDREGQRIVDAVLEHFSNKLPVKRLWLQGQDDTSVIRALQSLHENDKYAGLSMAASARARADWLVGMNLSSAFTAAAKKKGFVGMLSIGRVQTPVLNLVVGRDEAIANFKPKDYWSIKAKVEVKNGSFMAKFVPPKEAPYLDSAGRIADPKAAAEIQARLNNVTGKIGKLETKQHTDQAPLLYNLSKLTTEANKRFGFGAKKTLEVLQSLYDKHKIVTYPRSDFEYLPLSALSDAPNIMAHLTQNYPIANQANLGIQSSAFTDSKKSAHTGIVPTLKPAVLSQLTNDEKMLYELIALRYVAQFFPGYVYERTRVLIVAGPDILSGVGKVEIRRGWHDVIKPLKKESKDKDEDSEDSMLPKMETNEPAAIKDPLASAKKTKPPEYFTEGTLSEAMNNVHQFVTNPEIKLRLKEIAGIGTVATIPDIFESLFKHELMYLDDKKVKATETGKALIKAIPVSLKDPGITAMWEDALESISEGRLALDKFIEMQGSTVSKMVDWARSAEIEVPSSKAALKRYEDNLALYNKTCPACGKTMRQRTSKVGDKTGSIFWGCTDYPNCKHTEPYAKPKSTGGSKLRGAKAQSNQGAAASA